MPFEKGHNLSKGRPKGSTNKVEGATKQFLKQLIEGNTEKITQELDSLKGKAFLDAVFNFMEYVEPKLSRTEVKAEIEAVNDSEYEDMSVEDLKAIEKIKNKYK